MTGDAVAITATGAVCASGKSPAEIWDSLAAGRTSLAPVRRWQSDLWPNPLAGEIVDLPATEAVPDRKTHKLLRRTDLFGLFAASRAVESAGLLAFRAALEPTAAASFDDRTGVFVGSGGAAYEDQYDFLPLLAASDGSLGVFGRELASSVSPIWLLRNLPNNVLGHAGIRWGFKGANQCFTTHSVSGALAIAEGLEALRAGEADRALVIAHDSPIEPERILSFGTLGLLAEERLRPFDERRTGSLFGEGGAALVVETDEAARARGVRPLGHLLGSGLVTEGEGLLEIRSDGDGLARAIVLALEDAGIDRSDVAMIVAHGNGTRRSDASEAAAIATVFADRAPPVTAFKWAFGHLIAASVAVELVLALESLHRGTVPGIHALRDRDPRFPHLPVSAKEQRLEGDVALILGRGFAGTNVALVVRGTR